LTVDLSPVRDAAAALEAARLEFETQIVAASRLGLSNRAIAPAAGVSYERVRVIVNADPARAPRDSTLHD